MVNEYGVCTYGGKFLPAKRGKGFRDYRPGARMGGGFASGITRVEFGDGGVEVVDVEHEATCIPVFFVDFDNAEELHTQGIGLLIVSRKAGTIKEDALSADRDRSRRYVLGSEVSTGSDVGDVGLPTASDADAHYPTTIVSHHVFGEHFG